MKSPNLLVKNKGMRMTTVKYSNFSDSAAERVDVLGMRSPTWKAPMREDRPITCSYFNQEHMKKGTFARKDMTFSSRNKAYDSTGQQKNMGNSI